MKKLALFILFCITAYAFQSADARYRGCRGRCGVAAQYECGPIPCCEKQELVTIRKPADMVCGYVCPPDTCEVDHEEPACCK